MINQNSIVDQIYEAAVLPEFWPSVIEKVADHTDCFGGSLFSIGRHGQMMSASKTCEPILRALIEDGWSERNIRARRLVSRAPIGFLTDHDVCTEDEINNHPIYVDFLRPRGIGWSAATYIVGANDDIAVFSIDQTYEKGPISEPVRTFLNEMRPHIARAALLAAQFRMERIRGSLASLEQLGIPAAAIDRRGKIRAVNDRFSMMTPQVAVAAFDMFDIADDKARALFRQALAILDFDHASRSIPVPGADATSPFVIHIIPVKRQARDIFTSADAIVAIVPLNFPGLPFRTLVRSLYDFTQAEARVAEGLVSGQSAQAIAAEQGVSVQTVRTHVKNVLAKTGVGRQATLIARFSAFKQMP